MSHKRKAFKIYHNNYAVVWQVSYIILTKYFWVIVKWQLTFCNICILTYEYQQYCYHSLKSLRAVVAAFSQSQNSYTPSPSSLFFYQFLFADSCFQCLPDPNNSRPTGHMDISFVGVALNPEPLSTSHYWWDSVTWKGWISLTTRFYRTDVCIYQGSFSGDGSRAINTINTRTCWWCCRKWFHL